MADNTNSPQINLFLPFSPTIVDVTQPSRILDEIAKAITQINNYEKDPLFMQRLLQLIIACFKSHKDKQLNQLVNSTSLINKLLQILQTLGNQDENLQTIITALLSTLGAYSSVRTMAQESKDKQRGGNFIVFGEMQTKQEYFHFAEEYSKMMVIEERANLISEKEDLDQETYKVTNYYNYEKQKLISQQNRIQRRIEKENENDSILQKNEDSIKEDQVGQDDELKQTKKDKRKEYLQTLETTFNRYDELYDQIESKQTLKDSLQEQSFQLQEQNNELEEAYKCKKKYGYIDIEMSRQEGKRFKLDMEKLKEKEREIWKMKEDLDQCIPSSDSEGEFTVFTEQKKNKKIIDKQYLNKVKEKIQQQIEEKEQMDQYYQQQEQEERRKKVEEILKQNKAELIEKEKQKQIENEEQEHKEELKEEEQQQEDDEDEEKEFNDEEEKQIHLQLKILPNVLENGIFRLNSRIFDRKNSRRFGFIGAEEQAFNNIRVAGKDFRAITYDQLGSELIL
ncbi:MAG: hypothetical protein EZS28_006925 [Streblomastix strix]|uniref:Uncharacterized protein n=1 Tax=Streblomastix strix TaxID=222440 RepID=A0A5J4WT13_9EUKA|nr:MAG: hypothetical protein EZS28_006925 [Streblomastix strix]